MDAPRRKARVRLEVKSPATIAEAASMLSDAGSRLNVADALEIELHQHIAKLRKKPDRKIAQLRKEALRCGDALFAFWKEHEKEFADKRRIAVLSAGDLHILRTSPELIVANIKRTIQRLEELGRADLLRVKKEIKKDPLKDAIAGNPRLARKLRGVRTAQRELFYVRPRDAKSFLVRDPKGGRKKWRIESNA